LHRRTDETTCAGGSSDDRRFGPSRDAPGRSATGKFGSGASPYEGTKVVWRGDRLEWLFRNGLHDWWLAEVAAGRVVIPSPIG